jgi:hypothetical protein
VSEERGQGLECRTREIVLETTRAVERESAVAALTRVDCLATQVSTSNDRSIVELELALGLALKALSF